MRFAFFPEFLGHIRHVVKIAQVMLKKKNLKVVQKNNYFLDLCAFLEDSSSNPPSPQPASLVPLYPFINQLQQ